MDALSQLNPQTVNPSLSTSDLWSSAWAGRLLFATYVHHQNCSSCYHFPTYRPLSIDFGSPFAENPSLPYLPAYSTPECYLAPQPSQPPPLPQASEGTLFWAFYSFPRDLLQESSARELWSRNWRFAVEKGEWVTPVMGQQGFWTAWNAHKWEREKQMGPVGEIEDRGNSMHAGSVNASTQIQPFAAQTPSPNQLPAILLQQQQQQLALGGLLRA